MTPPASTTVTGSLNVFGYGETRATLRVLPRSRGWRALRSGALTLGGLVAAPVVALIPPHAAWALGAAVTGAVLGARKWGERFTLLSLRGSCPRCGAPLTLDRPGPLRNPATVDCEACHHAATLTIPAESLRPDR
ncbi:MAG TPA: hypothetical protein VLA43_10850 [Longimicrobiales bacterium]|nr:hypothetical protein [Longimicrobiales bacterium]